MSRAKSANATGETVKIGWRLPAEDIDRLKVAAALRREEPSSLLSKLIRTLPDPPAYPSQARISTHTV